MFLFTQTLGTSKRNDRMTNLLQVNIEMKTQRTNSTFGFCQHKSQRRKTKRAVFFPRSTKKEYTFVRKDS